MLLSGVPRPAIEVTDSDDALAWHVALAMAENRTADRES
jgi:hypothetical protein